ncbi:hypothetical protein [Pantoea dispersa]|uniref:hypothetical protein n=1 Tax=Pantoea dispersa TaxID=59814 RepID=UPI0007378145|nr:hypothetical protein [Pantoea dispersa]KTS01188.1 hypothetical protein NS375_01980 [Pantoea dispersa]
MNGKIPVNNSTSVSANKKNYAKALNFIGGLIAILSIIFVALRLNSYLTSESLSFFNLKHVLIVLILIVLYGLGSLLLGCAWKNILAMSGSEKKLKWAISTYGLAQIGKYIPGNIFHLAGRQALGLKDGVSGVALAKSTVWELGLLAISGAVFLIIAAPAYFNLPEIATVLSLPVFLVTTVVFYYFLSVFFNELLGKAFIQQVIFLTLSGFIFYFLICIVSEQGFLDFSKMHSLFFVPAAFVTAWLIGLVTPGAPAGMGIREVVLIYLLGGLYDKDIIILTVLISRIVTVLGDVFFYTISFYIRRIN